MAIRASPRTRVEIDRDGVLHVLAGHVTLHLDRDACKELTTTLAKAMVTLARTQPKRRKAKLILVAGEAPGMLDQSIPNAPDPRATAPA